MAAAMLAVGVAIVTVKAPAVPQAALSLAYVVVLALIAGYDGLTRRAPNALVYPAILVGAALTLVLGREDAVEALSGGVAAFAIMLIVAALGRGAMGAGDVKVAALCGLIVGMHGVPVLLFGTFIASAAFAAPLVLLRIRRGSDSIAFTPFLAIGTLVSMGLSNIYLWG